VHPALANALRARGDPDKTVAVWQQLLEVDPNNVHMNRELANALSAQGDLDGVIGVYRKLVVLTPDDPEPHMSLAEALRSKGKTKEASEVYRKAGEAYRKTIDNGVYSDPQLGGGIVVRPIDSFAYLGLGRALLGEKGEDPSDDVAA